MLHPIVQHAKKRKIHESTIILNFPLNLSPNPSVFVLLFNNMRNRFFYNN